MLLILADRSQLMVDRAEQFDDQIEDAMSFCLLSIENVLLSLIKGGMGCSQDQLLTRTKSTESLYLSL